MLFGPADTGFDMFGGWVVVADLAGNLAVESEDGGGEGAADELC